MAAYIERKQQMRTERFSEREKTDSTGNRIIDGLNARMVIGVIMLVFLVVFLFNLVRVDSKTDSSDKKVRNNIASVDRFQSASVTTIEKAIDKLDAAADSSGQNLANIKARYIKKFKNCVVVGDSLTEGLPLYGYLSSSQVFSKVGASVVSGEDLFTGAAATYPKCAFFAFGMNDMGNYSGNAKNFTAKYEELLKAFKKKSPDTKLYVCSISTPSADAIKGNSSIGNYRKFNKAIRAMCKKLNITYIDISYILKDDPDLYAGDGIHADTDYYPLWLDKMSTEARL